MHYYVLQNIQIFVGRRNLLIMMRMNFKLLFILCILIFVITFSLWSSCGNIPISDLYSHPNTEDNSVLYQLKGIQCHINNEEVVDCRRDKDEVFIPFTFLKKYFEINGKFSKVDGVQQFDWSHSFSKIYIPKGKYDPRGIFMHFENYNVEIRDRVKCISAIDGVPISTQWESQGYYYPTQIAQFGLSHYSKNLTEPQQKKIIIENGNTIRADWFLPPHSKLEISVDEKYEENKILKFYCDDIVDYGIVLKMDHVLDLVLGIDLFLRSNGSLKVALQNRENKDNYTLIYMASDILISAQDDVIYYGIGQINTWKHLTRDLVVDLQKGLALQYQGKPRKKLSKTKIKITSISLLGDGQFDNLTLASSEHLTQFYAAAEWFINNQDASGGWPNAVKRRVASGFEELRNGWYSAMGQGHAISVLSRAYYHSNGDKRYLNAALAGLRPFRVPSYQGGVLATFLGKYIWYEEYPTSPPSFVLNGFIYALLGLYDLKTLAPQNDAKEATLLYNEGMLSLKNMLLLYDMGSGTSYDLRHFTLKVAPNIARWDYHATHVNQLLILSTIDQDQLLATTADRWMGYMTGKRAAHN